MIYLFFMTSWVFPFHFSQIYSKTRRRKLFRLISSWVPLVIIWARMFQREISDPIEIGFLLNSTWLCRIPTRVNRRLIYGKVRDISITIHWLNGSVLLKISTGPNITHRLWRWLKPDFSTIVSTIQYFLFFYKIISFYIKLYRVFISLSFVTGWDNITTFQLWRTIRGMGPVRWTMAGTRILFSVLRFRQICKRDRFYTRLEEESQTDILIIL